MAENVADNILLRIVEETTKHNDNITKQMSADRTLLGKLITHNEMRDQKQDEQDKIDAEHQGIQTHLSQLADHKLHRIDEDADERPDMKAGKDDTKTDSVVSAELKNLTKETKEAAKDNKDGLEVLQASTEKAFGATIARWSKESKEWIEDNAKFSKFAGNVQADFSIMFGKLSLIQNIPGWKTITGLLKWIGALLLKFLTKLFIAKMGDRMEKMVQGFENFQVNWTKRTQESVDKARAGREVIKDAAKEKKEKREKEPGFKSRLKDKLKDRLQKRRGTKKSNKGAFKKGMDSGKEGSDKRTKTGRKTQKQFKSLTKGMGRMGKIMANIGRALAVAAAWFSGIMTGFVAAMTATGVTIGAVTIPVWGVVAIVVIIIALIAGLIYWLYLKWEEIGEWWDRMKVHMAAAMERMMLWKDKAVNWFSDMGTRLGFMIRKIIAVLLDGIAGALNHAIDLFNAIPLVPDVDWRMEEGRVDEVDEQRAQFEVESKKRGEELERRGKALDISKDEKMQAVLDQQSGGNVNQQINNNSTNQSNTDISISTAPSDSTAKSLADNHG